MARVSFVLSSRAGLLRLGLVLLSLALAVVRYGPLNGSAVALLLTVALQLYLPGYLLARAFGKTGVPHPISRFAWVLGCGLGLTVTLGGVLRFLQLPVPVYVGLLHGVMAGLALLPAPKVSRQEKWRFTWDSLPMHLLVLLACMITLDVGYERSRIRYSGFEDQTVFVSLADWLAHAPDDPGLTDRRAGRVNPITLWLTDGWTYTHAAWVWSSGVPAAQIIWHSLTPLFAWTVPLVVFALVYEVTQRKEAATWSVGVLLLYALTTLDDIVYYPYPIAFGQAAVFELSTLRKFSTGLMLPLALLSALAYLRTPRWRDLLLVFLLGLALATMHPQQIMMFMISIGATLTLWWLAHPDRTHSAQAAGLAVVLLFLLVLPYLQRQSDPIGAIGWTYAEETEILSSDSQQAEQEVRESLVPTGLYVERRQAFGHRAMILVLGNLPLLGTTYILDPIPVLNHPLYLLAVAGGMAAGAAWRRNLAAKYLFASTVAPLSLVFIPGLALLFIRFVSFSAAQRLPLMLPVAATLGIGLDALLQKISHGVRPRPVGLWGISAVLMVTMLLLVLEPVPILSSARDQIRAANEIESLRDIHPADELLLSHLATVIPVDERSIVLAPNRPSNYVIENIPHTLITGGRASGNATYPSTERFFAESNPVFPWLDVTDLSFVREAGVTHIVVEADDTRLPQLALSPQRFEPLGTAAGYFVFGVRQGIEATEEDDLFQRMNALYGQLATPRWDGDSFALARPADPAPWESLAALWAARLEQDAGDDIARYGLAFTYLMMGADDEALPLWEQLHERHPDVALFGEALAHTQLHLGLATDAVQTLRLALDGGSAAVRVLAARALLTESFFYLLDEAQVQRAVEVAEADRVVWSQLAELDRYREVRERAVLLLAAGQWDTAADWLARLPAPEVSPHDLLIRAMAALLQHEVDRALAILQPATDPDQIASKVFLHPDRWQDNLAAQVYYLLLGEVAHRAGRWAEAEAAYQQAVDQGALWAGRYFLAQTWRAAGQEARADALLAGLEEEWRAAYGSPFPELVSLLAVADHQALYVLDASISQDEGDRSLTLWATFGTHGQPYPVRSWHVRVTSRDATEHYAETEAPASFVNGALVRAPISIALPDGLPSLAQGRVFVEPRHSDLVIFAQQAVDVVLNRPASASMGPDAIPTARQIGPDIALRGYEIDRAASALTVTLYWQAASRPPEDYQVMVHLVDESGQLVALGDSGPVEGRYPTSQWRLDTLIADRHVIPLREPLPEGRYAIRVGLYRLADGSRLPVTPADERVIDNSVVLETFSR